MNLKAIFLYIILICSGIYGHSNEGSLVFVHIGPQLPSYVKFSLDQARLFNPDGDIYLIASKKALAAAKGSYIKHNNIIAINCEDLERTKEHSKFLREFNKDGRFKQGFWIKTSERFFYIDEFMHQYGVQNVIHMEYDNMLYVDFNSLLSVFESYNSIAAVLDSKNRCVPSIIYFKNTKSIRHLVTFMADRAREGNNDMRIIAKYNSKFNNNHIDNLPIVMKEYTQDYQLANRRNEVALDPSPYFNKINEFQSIFDGAAIGQYLGGIDPSIRPSKPGFVNETCLFNPSYFQYKWIKDDQQRKVPFAVYKGKYYRINNLHIHSKNLKKFVS